MSQITNAIAKGNLLTPVKEIKPAKEENQDKDEKAERSKDYSQMDRDSQKLSSADYAVYMATRKGTGRNARRKELLDKWRQNGKDLGLAVKLLITAAPSLQSATAQLVF